MVMSQLADPNAGPPLGEIIVPEINAPDARPVRVAARASWQLRVHPPQEGIAPFELSRPDEEPTGVRMDKVGLRAELARLHAEGTGKPLLAPHADSRSEDMLEALPPSRRSGPARDAPRWRPRWRCGEARHRAALRTRRRAGRAARRAVRRRSTPSLRDGWQGRDARGGRRDPRGVRRALTRGAAPTLAAIAVSILLGAFLRERPDSSAVEIVPFMEPPPIAVEEPCPSPSRSCRSPSPSRSPSRSRWPR